MLLPVLKSNVELAATFQVPPVSVLPESCVTVPMICNVPVCTLALPVLLNVRLTMAVPVPAERSSVPALLKLDAAPPKLPNVVFARISNVPLGDWLLNTPPLPKLLFAAVTIAVPALLIVRPIKVGAALAMPSLIVIPPLALVTPVPDMTPPDQVVSPLTLTVAGPVSVPDPMLLLPKTLNVPTSNGPLKLMFAIPPLLMLNVVGSVVGFELTLAVPPLTVNVDPRFVIAPLKFAVPPLTVVLVAMSYAPASVVVPPLNVTLPAPLTGAVAESVRVPPEKNNAAPDDTL